MLKFKVELDLGNEAMQTAGDVRRALERGVFGGSERVLWSTSHLVEGDGGVLRDENGNRVGVWSVEDTRGTDER